MMMTEETPLHIREFGSNFTIDDEILAVLEAAGFEDDSWHNDICPSFVRPITHYGRPDGTIVKIWIDAENPAHREFDEDSDTRFMVSVGEEGDCCSKEQWYFHNFGYAIATAIGYCGRHSS